MNPPVPVHEVGFGENGLSRLHHPQECKSQAKSAAPTQFSVEKVWMPDSEPGEIYSTKGRTSTIR